MRAQPRRHGDVHARTGHRVSARVPGESAPVLVSQRTRLGPPAFPESPVYPIAATTANSVNIFPRIATSGRRACTPTRRASSGRSAATWRFEARYVGNRNNNTWAEEDWNERSVFNSGFYEEFKLAQRNIAANIAAGMGNRGFAYTGRPARRRCRFTSPI